MCATIPVSTIQFKLTSFGFPARFLPMKASSTALAVLLFLACSQSFAQTNVIRLYDGPAPGSEDWRQIEQENRTNLFGTRVVFNVTTPTLTVFRPDPGQVNGAAVVICPGGGFFCLSMDSEGFDVARWLCKKGFTCFVLKYRLVECKTHDPVAELLGRGQVDAEVTPVVKLATADGLAAMGYVRQHAAEFSVNPERIGIIGFSAGGTVAVSVARTYSTSARPDFVALIYADCGRALKGNGVPADAPPTFVLAASNDQAGLAPQSVEIYQNWIAAGKSAELHLYSKGGHGFGMREQHLPSDHWIERFTDWLDAQGLTKN